MKGWRTQAFGVLVAVLGVVQIYAPEVLPDAWRPWAMMAIGIAIIVLREITTTRPRRAE